jgi:predicted RND superfamily exporter protein
MATAAITAMGVSIGADFAIYLIYRMREERRTGGGLVESVEQALLTAGHAVCFVSSAIVAGYLTLLGAGFRTWTHVGVLTSLMITASALATLTVLPAIVVIIRPRFLDPAERDTRDASNPGSTDAAAVEASAHRFSNGLLTTQSSEA